MPFIPKAGQLKGGVPKQAGSSFFERLRLGFGTSQEQATRVEPKGFLAGGISEIPKDIADIIGPSLRTAGLIGGGIAGVAGGLAGSVGGAAAGAGAGEFLRQRIGELIGVQKEGAGAKFRKIGEEAIAGGLAELGGIGVSKVLGPALKFLGRKLAPVGRFSGEAGKSILRATTGGVPEKAIEQAAKFPKAVRAGFKPGVTAKTIREETLGAFNQYNKITKTVFREGIDKIAENVPKKLVVPVVAKKEFGKLVDDFVKTAKEFRVTFKGNKISGFPVKMDVGARSNIKKAFVLLKRHKDFSTRGIQNLAEDIQSLIKFERTVPVGGAKVAGQSPVLFRASAKLSDFIRKQYPVLGELRTEFAKRSRIIKNANRLLNAAKKDDPIAVRTSVQKLSNIFKEDNDIYLQVLRELEKATGKKILSKLAGTEFQRIAPRFVPTALTLGAIGGVGIFAQNPLLLLLLPLLSPRAVGGLVTRGAQAVGVGAAGTRVAAPAGKQALILLANQLLRNRGSENNAPNP